MLTIEEALARVLASVRDPNPALAERVALTQANWRIAAAELTANHASPPFDNSAMDGFAVRAADTRASSADGAGRVRLRLVGEIAAGATAVPSLPANSALRIMTGAPIPAGADAVAIWEQCHEGTADDARWIEVPQTPVGQHIRRRGEDLVPGERLIAPGTLLDAADIMVLAGQGRAHVPVYPQPRVAVISTGDELVDLHETPLPGQIFDANSYGMAALVASVGAQPFRLGIAKDHASDIAAQVRDAHADAVVISGGISGSERDFVRAALAEAGASLELWKVAMRPGKPFAFARLGEVPIFAVPGNPVSAATSFELFVRPALLKMAGARQLHRPRLAAALTRDVAGTSRAHVVRVTLTQRDDGRFEATPHPKQGSGMMSSLLQWHGYVTIDAGSNGVPAGTHVVVSVRAWPQCP